MGYWCKKENVEELSAGLERLINDAALRQRLGARQSCGAEREFSSPAYLAHFCELIDSALQASATAP